jgi:hypothetical protein
MHHLRSISLLLLIGIFFSCSKDAGSSAGENRMASTKFTLTAQDTIEIPIDSTTSNFVPRYQYLALGKAKMLSIFNKNTNSIQLYDLSKKENAVNVKLETEGANAISGVLGYFIHNLDSIFIPTANNNEIFLVDSSGVIKDRFEVTDDLGIDPSYEIAIDGFFTPSFDPKTNLLTLWARPFIDTETREHYQHAIAIDYDIKERRVQKNYGGYPDFYKQDDLYFLLDNFERLPTPRYDVHYFDGSHELFLYDVKSKELIKKAFLKSEFLPDKIPASNHAGKPNLPLQDQRNYHITTGRYHRLLYDSTNRLFYRMVRHPQDLKTSDGLLNGHLTNKISVLIANEDLEYAGEFELPENVYIDRFSFVSDGKLWININHPESDMNKEDFLQFIVFKPERQ